MLTPATLFIQKQIHHSENITKNRHHLKMDHSPDHNHTWPSYFPPPPLQLLSEHHVAVFFTAGAHMQGRKDVQEAPWLKKDLKFESLTSTLFSLLVTE
jgi:hypothetical protein